MLTEVCQYLRNWFTRAMYFGTFKIENGELQTQFDSGGIDVIAGQYVRIIGSRLNDGVYQYPTEDLQDEEFNGAVWTMSVPPAVLSIVQDIITWQEKYNTADSEMLSPYTSESFGGYSYSKGSNSSASDGGGTSWKNVFATRLAPWRKI